MGRKTSVTSALCGRASLHFAALVACAALGAVACDQQETGAHGHDEGHGHGHGQEEKRPASSGHDHASAHPDGHDHHEEGHGHGDTKVVTATLWSADFEVFLEHTPAVVGREMSLLLHVTDLPSFTELREGTVRMELFGPGSLSASVSGSTHPGIYELSVTPKVPGEYTGQLRVSGTAQGRKVSGVVEGLTLRVFPDEGSALSAALEDHAHDSKIEFLKEQQWGVPFSTAFARPGTVVPATRVAGHVGTPPGGTAEISAPLTGTVRPPKGGLPFPGAKVTEGQVLAWLTPAPASPEGPVRAKLNVKEAEARARAAELAFARAKRLIEHEAISQREFEDARREQALSVENLRSAKQASSLYAGSRHKGGWKLTAPISGTLSLVNAMPGRTAEPGDVLFRIVQPRPLWITARVPEQEAARLRTDRGATYRLAGREDWTAIQIAGSDENAKIISVGTEVDPVSRTVQLIYELPNPEPHLRVGGLVDLDVPVGDEFVGIVVPKTALIDQEGRSVVYVQDDGEHFMERLVRVGPRTGQWVAVQSGLKEGERIVTRGAHLVRLAERAKGGGGHGHIH